MKVTTAQLWTVSVLVSVVTFGWLYVDTAAAAVLYSQPLSGSSLSVTMTDTLSTTQASSTAFVATSAQLLTNGSFTYAINIPAGIYAVACVCDVTTAVRVACAEALLGTGSTISGKATLNATGNEGNTTIIGNTYRLLYIKVTAGTSAVSFVTDGVSMKTTILDSGGGSIPIDWAALYTPVVYSSTTAAIATSSALWSTLALASSTQSCNSGNIFTDGLCSAGTFLFIPNPQILQSYADLASTTIPSKFPFSWLFGVSAAFSGLSASSTANMIAVTLPFHTLGVGSTTPLGLANIVASDVGAFSTTTIQTYIPATTWALFQSLIALAIWLAFAGDVFFTVRNQMHRV